MKKLCKRFAVLVIALCLATSVFSGCFSTTYEVKFDFSTGGEVEVKIGNTTVTHGSFQTHNRTLVITVTPTGFNQIKSVQINSVPMTGTNGVYTHVLRSNVTIKVEFEERLTLNPCVLCFGFNCNYVRNSLQDVKVININALLHFRSGFASDPEAAAKVDAIDTAIENIRKAQTRPAVDAIFETVFEELFPDTPIEFPGYECAADCNKNCNRAACLTNNRACRPTCCFCCECKKPDCPSCTMCLCQCDGDICWTGPGCCPSTHVNCEPEWCTCIPDPKCACILCKPPCECGDEGCEKCEDCEECGEPDCENCKEPED